MLQNHPHIIDRRHARRPLVTRVSRGAAVSAGQTSARVREADRSRSRIPPRCAAAGNRAAILTSSGGSACPFDETATAMTRLWTSRCTAWISAAGSHRRAWTRASCRVDTVPARSGPASIRAAATASATARLMPTPPTGDIACAASPINSRPSVYQRLSRLSCTSSSLTSSNDVSARTSVGQPRHQGHHAAVQRLDALRAQLRRRGPWG